MMSNRCQHAIRMVLGASKTTDQLSATRLDEQKLRSAARFFCETGASLNESERIVRDLCLRFLDVVNTQIESALECAEQLEAAGRFAEAVAVYANLESRLPPSDSRQAVISERRMVVDHRSKKPSANDCFGCSPTKDRDQRKIAQVS